MKTEIFNFCNGDPVTVAGYVDAHCGPIVYIGQKSGSCNFTHSMRPDQALAMAESLIAAAKKLTEVQT